MRLSLYYGGVGEEPGMMGGRGGDMVLGKKGCEADLCEGASAAGGLCEGGLHTGRFIAVHKCLHLR